MPIYECLTSKGTLDLDQRGAFASEATRIHVEETGSRAQFVHVLFPELPAGHAYTAGHPAAPAVIRAWIRTGRPPERREAILRRLERAYLDLTGVDPMEVMVLVLEVPPECALSGGLVMPTATAADESEFYDAIDRSGQARHDAVIPPGRPGAP